MTSPPMIPITSKSPRQLIAELWRRDRSFRGFVEFGLIGAILLCFLHGLAFRVSLGGLAPSTNIPALPSAYVKAPPVQSARMPSISDVFFDEQHFAKRSEPLR